MTLYPWEFGPRREWNWWSTFPIRSVAAAVDAVLNVALYVPFGAFASGWLRHSWKGLAVAIVAALTLSLIVETLQLYLPGRIPNVRDVIANLCGSVLGAALLRRWERGHLAGLRG